MRIFHIMDKLSWYPIKKEGKDYAPETLNHEGFIHCCKIDEILMVANAFFKGKHGLMLLVINQKKVTSKVVPEGQVQVRGQFWTNIAWKFLLILEFQ